MSTRTIDMNEQLYGYFRSVAFREPPVMEELRKATEAIPMSIMQISTEQGQFMALMVELIGAKKIVEVGTFTGYSSLWMASALPEDGKITACDVSEEWTNMAKEYWEKAGVSHKIDLRLAPAVETLKALIEDGQAGTYDMAFIDADKANYGAYYEHSLTLLRPGGVVLVDNCFWSGSVANPEKQDADTVAIRALNKKIHEDERVTQNLVPIGDGVMMARKR